jgi:hypothetical protein
MTSVLLAGAVVVLSFVVISRQRAVAMPVVFAFCRRRCFS